MLPVVGIEQAHQRAELNALAGVVAARAELTPIGNRLADGFGATDLAGGQVGRFESQGVVLVLGDVLFVIRRFMRRPHGLFACSRSSASRSSTCCCRMNLSIMNAGVCPAGQLECGVQALTPCKARAVMAMKLA